jgi:hypothetical protein
MEWQGLVDELSTDCVVATDDTSRGGGEGDSGAGLEKVNGLGD